MNSTPNKRPSKREHAERIDTCVKLIASGLHDGVIKRTISEKYGCAPRTVEGYLCRARGILREQRNMSREDHQAESLAFYRSMLTNKNAATRDKLFARKRIDELLGLEEPRRMEHSGPAGGPIKTESTVSPLITNPELREEAGELAAKLAREIEAGHDGETG